MKSDKGKQENGTKRGTSTGSTGSNDGSFQEISELIADKTGLLMTVEQVEGLWDEIQREELKRLVYQAFMAIQQDRMLAKKAASGEEPASSDEAK